MLNKEIDNRRFLWYSLYAFAEFVLELLLLAIENYFIKSKTTFSNCLHWTLTMTLWGLVSYILYKNSKKKLNYDIYIQSKVSKNKVIIVAGIIFVYLLAKYFIVGGIKPIQEFNNLGVIKFIFQYAYYFFETLLILLTIAFGQKFMDNIFKDKNIPYGGIILACTWGLMHALTQNFATGIFAFVSAIIYGIVYLLLNKNTKYSYLSILLIFMF